MEPMGSVGMASLDMAFLRINRLKFWLSGEN
jgi:hypothetical protein